MTDEGGRPADENFEAARRRICREKSTPIRVTLVKPLSMVTQSAILRIGA